ncbi:MAG: hypothetical protein CL624_04490 [Arcobacter sp.]|nr:hypothetical protein [Arcobacter sp.]|tara:strand:- start:4409 stop:5227 length:819 start_codon:yes stop_codon:yes gene_type:complete
MSLISKPTASPNRIEMLVEFLKTNNKKYTKKDLELMFSPDSGAVFKEVYAVVEMLGLLVIKEDIVYHNIDNKNRKNKEIIKRSLFDIQDTKNYNFNISLAWLLIQKPNELISFKDNVGNKFLRDLTEQISDTEFTNNARFQHFIYWCEYLGFVNKISISGETYISPDPTQVIKNELEFSFKKGERLSVKDFFLKLSSLIPILEYGVIREKVNGMLRDGLSLPSGTLSYSTSLAIIRLEQQKIISLESKSDAEVVTLLDGTKNKRISHIKYLG